MYCGSCKTEFDREPLIVYNGEWYCPYCLSSLFPKPKVARNFENVRKYAESERLFHEGWLLKKDRKALDTALRLAREAAYEHNPNALVAMGYYHEKNYLNPFASETERVRSAYQYYRAVAVYDPAFRRAFSPDTVAPEAELNSGELEALSKTAVENLYALIGGTTDEAAEAVFRMSKEAALVKLEGVLKIARPDRDGRDPEAERYPTAEEFLTELRDGEICFGFQKADARLLRELASFEGKDANRELNADNFLQKLGVTAWILWKDKTWLETEAGNKNEFSKAAESGVKRFVIAYFKNGIGKITHKKAKLKIELERATFDGYRKKLAQNGMLYPFRKADVVIAAKTVREEGEIKRDALFEAALQKLYQGGL